MVQTKCGEIKGYTADFYVCLDDMLQQGKDCEFALAYCERLFG